jgi:hypothetical protein
MFNHLNSNTSSSLFQRIILAIKEKSFLRIIVDENSAFFGGSDAPIFIQVGETVDDLQGAFIVADADTKFTTLEDDAGVNMLLSYMGSFTSASTLKENRIIRAANNKKIKKVVLTSGAIWIFKTR